MKLFRIIVSIILVFVFINTKDFVKAEDVWIATSNNHQIYIIKDSIKATKYFKEFDTKWVNTDGTYIIKHMAMSLGSGGFFNYGERLIETDPTNYEVYRALYSFASNYIWSEWKKNS